MAAKKNRIDTAGGPPLVSNPFAEFAKRSGGASSAPPALAPPPGGSPSAPAAKSWRVERTKKGGFPLSVEKRAAGKIVTVVARVSGDSAGLLRELKKLCGAGGHAGEDFVELQGDHCARIEAFLRR